MLEIRGVFFPLAMFDKLFTMLTLKFQTFLLKA